MKLAALLVLVPALAFADDPPTVGEEIIRVDEHALYIDGVNTSGSSTTTRSYRSISKGWMIIDGQELGTELRFLTAPTLSFTDVMLLTVRGRAAIAKRVDAFAAVDLLPKQPSTTDELVWQSASAGINMQPWDKPLALHVRGAGGVMLDRTGYWGQADVGAIARKPLRVHDVEVMLLEGGVSALGTRLSPDAGDNGWLVEAALSGSILFHDPEGWTGGWLGFHYGLPVAHGAMLDPQPRVDVEFGVVLSFIEHWDVFGRFAVIDRGDAEQMATQLPILDGGFDQKQAVFGLTYHTR